MPNNIVMSFPTYFCEGCLEADIEIIDHGGASIDGYPVKVTKVQCKHENACRRILDLRIWDKESDDIE